MSPFYRIQSMELINGIILQNRFSFRKCTAVLIREYFAKTN